MALPGALQLGSGGRCLGTWDHTQEGGPGLDLPVGEDPGTGGLRGRRQPHPPTSSGPAAGPGLPPLLRPHPSSAPALDSGVSSSPTLAGPGCMSRTLRGLGCAAGPSVSPTHFRGSPEAVFPPGAQQAPQMCLLGAVSQAIKHSDHVTQDSILQVFIQENKADVPTKACTRMFTALGFTTAKR